VGQCVRGRARIEWWSGRGKFRGVDGSEAIGGKDGKRLLISSYPTSRVEQDRRREAMF
jgi:hypothetical protein